MIGVLVAIVLAGNGVDVGTVGFITFCALVLDGVCVGLTYFRGLTITFGGKS